MKYYASRHVFFSDWFPPRNRKPRMLLQRSELIQVLTHGVPRAVLGAVRSGAVREAVR